MLVGLTTYKKKLIFECVGAVLGSKSYHANTLHMVVLLCQDEVYIIYSYSYLLIMPFVGITFTTGLKLHQQTKKVLEDPKAVLI